MAGSRTALIFLVMVVAFGFGLATETHAEDALGDSAVVTATDGDGVNVRAGAGVGFRLVGAIAEGEHVVVLDGPRWVEGQAWYEVRHGAIAGTPLRGWVVGHYLAPPGRAASDRLAARSVRRFMVTVTAYAPGGGAGEYTASGTRVRWGTVSVDPAVIPLGSLLTIDGLDGVFRAEDTGPVIRGQRLDVWFADVATALRWGVQRREVTVLREGF